MSQAVIAEQVGIGHSTVSRWLAAPTLPETTRGPNVSRLDPYLPYLFQRRESGCHTMAALFRELVDRGYTGSYESVRDHLVRRLSLCHPEGELAYTLVQQFAQMLRTRTGEQLDAWLEKVRASQIREFQSFVLGIERDKAAAVAGLTLPQNNGLVEGKVNKLKLIKRMGYGRAGFPLLRQRVLHAL
jgi:transposase